MKIKKLIWYVGGMALLISTSICAKEIIVSCKSSGARYKLCSMNINSGLEVRLQKQLSSSPCIKGDSWDYNENGVWVSKGCRARFSVIKKDGESTIRCKSSANRRQFCRTNIDGSVRLLRQLSSSPCQGGKTWGYNKDGIWVDGGCRADFTVFRGDTPRRSTPSVDSGENTIRCKSSANRRQFCRINIDGSVRLLGQLSSSPCQEGKTWGYNKDGIWVDGGCRADFTILGDTHSRSTPRVDTPPRTDSTPPRTDAAIPAWMLGTFLAYTSHSTIKLTVNRDSSLTLFTGGKLSKGYYRDGKTYVDGQIFKMVRIGGGREEFRAINESDSRLVWKFWRIR